MAKSPSRSRSADSDHSVEDGASDFPKHTLERAIVVPRLIEDQNGGRPMPPTDVAIGLGISPGSSDFRVLLSSSYKYGLTEGSYRKERIVLTELGARIALPSSDAALRQTLIEAALRPDTFGAIFRHFRGKKLPDDEFFKNTVVRDFGVSRPHATKCVQVFRANAEWVGLVRQASTGLWLSGEADGISTRASGLDDTESRTNGEDTDAPLLYPTRAMTQEDAAFQQASPNGAGRSLRGNNRVFVSHGKNRSFVPQLKELLEFGRLVPIVSIEHETVSKPVPDKVLDDMRSCGAAVIHIDAESEGRLINEKGDSEVSLNQNVLIEIGAAMALYGRRFILLVKNGVKLPTNLQGLYQVRYEGEKLDGDATLRLLKAFNDFRSESTS